MSTVSSCPKARLRRRTTGCSQKLEIFNAQLTKRVIQYRVQIVVHIKRTLREGNIRIAEKCNFHYQYHTISRTIAVVKMGRLVVISDRVTGEVLI